jgi:hypothetical protein
MSYLEDGPPSGWPVIGLAAGDPAIDAGHNFPQEEPAAFAEAVLTVRQWLHAGELG